MITLINRVADRALGLVLPEASAGACVPEVGRVCKCVKFNYCIPPPGDDWFVYTFACNGTCNYHTNWYCRSCAKGD